jgi:hypothetical protein
MTAEEKFYSHVQPFDSKFILDFLSDELFIDDGDLKFLSWDDLDRALESDATLKEKLSNIARDKEVHELKKIANQMTRDDTEVVAYGDPGSNNIYTKFVPYEGTKNYKFNNNENDIFYYYNEVKRSVKDKNVEQLKKLFGQ